jgi:L-lactate dehydrogenase (cytochrome)/glycolate oxidase
MSNQWFETVAEAHRRAKKRLPSSVYGAIVGGAQEGLTLADNKAAFGELGFAPHVADLHAERDQSTSVMGQPISMPVIVSPTGIQGVNPQGEVAVALASANRGTVMSLSSFASRSVEDVVQANPQTFMQLYWCGSRENMVARMDRAKAAGVSGAILTLDWSFSDGRDWGSPVIPEKVDLKTMMQHAPEALRHPRWLFEFLKVRQIPDLTTPNMALPGQDAPTFFGAYWEWMETPPPSWDDIAWLVAEWGGPIMLKGIIRIDDAKRAVDVGMTAISVSNHGGNNLDCTPASIRALGPIADAVGDDIEVVLDGGIRRGSDVVKALAFGAKAVMIGRAGLWGLAANGQAGVENVFDLLRSEIDSALLGLAKASIAELSRDDIVIPTGFELPLGL